MKSPVTLKVPSELLGAVVILVVVLTGIIHAHFSVETQRKGLELVQGKVLESKDGNQRSLKNPSAPNAINHSVDNSQPVKSCNMEFSFCPTQY